jgi:hypothetical protein
MARTMFNALSRTPFRAIGLFGLGSLVAGALRRQAAAAGTAASSIDGSLGLDAVE